MTMDIDGLYPPPIQHHFSAPRGRAGLESRSRSIRQTAADEKDSTRRAGESFQEIPSILHVSPPHTR